MDHQDIAAKTSALMPDVLSDLERLVAIPSVAAPGRPDLTRGL